MMDENQTPITNGTGDGSAAQAGGNPFAGDATQAQNGQQANMNGVAETPSWLQMGAADPQPVAQEPVQNTGNTFDPFSNPFDTGAATPAPAAVEQQPTPEPVMATEVSQEEEMESEDDMFQGSSDNAMTLLLQIQKQFSQEEEDYRETLQMHEENIKAEQEAIRQLRQARREEKESMKNVLQGLEEMLGMNKTKAPSQEKTEAPKKAPKKAEKKPETRAAKKIDSDDFFSAA